MASQVVEIADTVREGKKVKVSDKEEHGDMVDRFRLMIDAREWLASKLAPKKYGDKVAAELSGPDGGPIVGASMVLSRLREATGRNFEKDGAVELYPKNVHRAKKFGHPPKQSRASI